MILSNLDPFTHEEKTKIKLSMICTLKDTQDSYERALKIGDSREIKQIKYQVELIEKVLDKIKKW